MRQIIEGYLASKWFLQNSLPLVHPYYNTVPNCNAAYSFIAGQTAATISAIPNLLVWFDTSVSLALNSNGASVPIMNSVFTMAGCNNFYLQGTPTTTTSVLNGYPVLTFTSGQNAIMYPTGYTSVAFTVIFLYRQTGGANNRFAQCGTGNNYLLGYWAGYKNVWYMDGWITNASGPGQDTQWDINVFQSDSAGNCTFRNNGSNVSIITTNGNGIKGMAFNYPNEPSNSQLAEMYMFTTNIPSSNYILIEGYIAWKWGIQSRLNPSHLYASTNPNAVVTQNTLAPG
jgi:hypothetical protein